MTLAKRNTQAERARERREAEEEKKLRRKKLTPKEQEELEEKEFEEACERWIGKIIRVVSHAGVQPRTGQTGAPLIHLAKICTGNLTGSGLRKYAHRQNHTIPVWFPCVCVRVGTVPGVYRPSVECGNACGSQDLQTHFFRYSKAI